MSQSMAWLDAQIQKINGGVNINTYSEEDKRDILKRAFEVGEQKQEEDTTCGICGKVIEEDEGFECENCGLKICEDCAESESYLHSECPEIEYPQFIAR